MGRAISNRLGVAVAWNPGKKKITDSVNELLFGEQPLVWPWSANYKD